MLCFDGKYSDDLIVRAVCFGLQLTSVLSGCSPGKAHIFLICLLYVFMLYINDIKALQTSIKRINWYFYFDSQIC